MEQSLKVQKKTRRKCALKSKQIEKNSKAMDKAIPFVSEIGQHKRKEISRDDLDEIYQEGDDRTYSPGYDMVFLHAAVSEMIARKKLTQNQIKVITVLLGYHSYPFCPEHFIGMRTQRKVAEMLNKKPPNVNKTIKRIGKKIQAFLDGIDVNNDVNLQKEFPSYYVCKHSVKGFCQLYHKKCLNMCV